MKRLIQHFVILFTLLTILNGKVYSAGELFRSVASGNWNSTSTWEMSTNGGGSWIAATTTPDNTSSTIKIRSPHIVTITADVTADQLVVDGGGQISIDNTIILTIPDGSGTDLTLNSGATVSGAGSVHTQGPNNNLFILAGSNFNVTLRVLNGATVVLDPSAPFKSILYGTIIIDSGAIFDVVAFGYFVQANGNVTNNGTIRGHASTFIVKGSSMVNNGSIIVHFLNFDSTTSISGTGTFTSNIIKVGTSGNVSLSGDVTFTPAQKVEIITGGVLNPNGNIFSIIANSNPSFDLHAGATVVNSGTFQTKGPSVVLHIRSGSNFNAPLKVSSGFAHALDPTPNNLAIFYGTITVDAGTNFHVGSPNFFTQANGIVINNGTIDAPNATFIVNGSSLINNGSIKPTNLTFNSITSLSGTGTYTGTNIKIGSSGNVSLSNNVTFSVGQKLEIDTGGTLNPNGNIFSIAANSNPSFDLHSGATVVNSGIFQTKGPSVVLHIRSGSNFNAPLKVNSGFAHALDPTPNNLAIFYGTITVDAGTNFHVGSPNYYTQANNIVTNNGTIDAPSATFIVKGSSLINNGSIKPTNLTFDSITSLSGTGTYTGTNIKIGSSGNISLSNDVTFSPVQKLEIVTGGTLNPNGKIFSISANSNPSFDLQSGATVTNSGTFRTMGPSVVLHIRSGSNFNAPLKVSSGFAHALEPDPTKIGIFYGTITVDAGTNFHVGQPNYSMQANNAVINNGIIGTSGGGTFIMRGPNLINNGTINPATFNFDSTTLVSGNGTISSSVIRIRSSGNVSLSGNVTFSPAQRLEISSGGILNPNGNIFSISANSNPSFVIQAGGTVLNSGIFRTIGPSVVLHIVTGSNFDIPLKVSSGFAHALDPSPTNLAIFNQTITVDAGANFHVGAPSYNIRANNNVINNGTIGAAGGGTFIMRGSLFTNNGTMNPTTFNFDTFADTLLNTGTISGGTTRFYGATFINNGNVAGSVFNFETGAHTLQGTGFWSMEPQILNGSNTTLLSDHQMSSVTIHGGGTFNISSRKLLVNRGGTPIGVIGSMITTGSTIEYNGTSGQTIQTSNLTYNNLTINNPAGVNLPTAESIPSIVTLTTGTFSVGSSLTMENGSTIVRQNGSLSGTPNFSTGVHVIYIGTNATTSGTELPASNTVLKNLTINNSGGVTLSNTRTVNDTLFLTKGTFSNGANLTFANGSTINRRAGILNSVPIFGTSVNVIYSDTTAVLTGNEIPASPTILNNLTINNTGGVTLSSNTTANGILTFSNGLLHLGSNTFTAGASSSVGGTPSSSSMIVASGAGTVRKNFTGSSFLFPVGDNIGITEYSPITLNFVSGTFGAGAYTEVNLKNVNHPNNESPEHYLNRYWTVTQNNIDSFSCEVTGSYVDADVTGNEGAMWTGSWNGSSWTLLNQADTVNNKISGTVASFSDFTGGEFASNTCSLAATITPDGPTTFCQGGSVTLTSNPASTYLWSPGGETTQSITVSSSGNYTAFITDANNCSDTSESTVVTVNILPLVSASPDVSICPGNSTTLTGSGASSYEWSPTMGLNTTTGADVIANPSSTTTYTVTGTDANGCSDTATVTVTVNPLPTLTVSPNVSICSGSSTTLICSGASSYQWSPSTGLNTTTGTDVIANPSSTTTYTVTGTDANGCTNSATVIVKVNPLPTLTVSPNVSICSGSSTTLIGSGASSYEWSPSTGLNTTTGADVIANPYSTITYTVTGTDANGCNNTATVTVTVNPLPTVNAGTDQSIYSGCLTQNATLTASASGGNEPFTYLWSPGGETTQSITVTPSSTSTYTVTVTNASGCSSSDEVEVEVIPVSLSVTAGDDQSIYGGCVTQSATLTASASGGFEPSYLWSPGGETTQSITVSPFDTTTYTVTVTNSLGCSVSDEVVVNVTPVSIAVDAGEDKSIFTGCVTQSSTITASVEGGFDPTYLWSPGGETTQTIVVSPSGTTTYTVTVTNSFGCSSSDQVVVNVTPVSLSVDAGSDTTIYLGYGPQSTTLTAVSSGGYSPAYLWTPGGATTQSITVSPTTTTIYTVQVTNSIGCIAADEIQVNVYNTRCGNNGNKVLVCHNGITICVSEEAISAHLDHGDHLASCNGETDNLISGEIINEIPHVYMLHANYPNPFNPVTTLNYDLPYDSKVTLKVYDMRGSEIATLVNGQMSAGYYTAKFNGGNLPTGVYFYKLTATSGTEQYVKVMKMVLIK